MKLIAILLLLYPLGAVLWLYGWWDGIPGILRLPAVLACLGSPLAGVALLYIHWGIQDADFGRGYKYSDVARDGSGIAIDPGRRVIKLSSRGMKLVQEYSYPDVREWGFSCGTFYSPLIEGHTATSVRGLYVNVRDVNQPHWRIGFQREAIMRKWMEILNQTINEGTT